MTKRELLDGCSYSDLEQALRDKKSNQVYGCLGKAAMDETLFVLKSTDKLAPPIIELWANLADLHGAPEEKVIGAISDARAMESWPVRKFPD